jgi:hypothetical protein
MTTPEGAPRNEENADLFQICHSGAGRNPGKSTIWTPAFAGVTNISAVPYSSMTAVV